MRGYLNRVSQQVWGSGENIPGRGDSKCKGSGACLKPRELSGVTGVVWERWENKRQ